jgi:hypothetical protein
MLCSLIDVFMAPFTQRQKGFTKLSVLIRANHLVAIVLQLARTHSD